jgi:hypothetical protein
LPRALAGGASAFSTGAVSAVSGRGPPSLSPHWKQLAALTSFTAPQAGHGARCSAPPQALQNFASGGQGFSQKGQTIAIVMAKNAVRVHCSSGTRAVIRCPKRMRPALILLLALAAPAFAQEQEVQRALIERDQHTAEFAARLRGAPLEERQRLENLSVRQLREVEKGLSPGLRVYERQKAKDEFVLRLPPPVVRAREPEKPRELPAKIAGTVDVILPPGGEN